MDVQAFAERLFSRDDFLIITHARPDGDTAGSAYALCRGLRAAGKTAFILENPDMTARYVFLYQGLEPPPGFDAKTIVCVDIASPGMLHDTQRHYEDHIDFAVDHHTQTDLKARYVLADPGASAAGQLVYAVLKAYGSPLDAEMLKGLYIAVATDTGCFRYSNTSAPAHHIAAEAISAGVDIYALNRVFFEVISHAAYELKKRVLNDMEFFFDRRAAVIILPLDLIAGIGAGTDDLEGLSEMPTTIDGVLVGLTVKQTLDGNSRVSVRTIGAVDAAALCRGFGGGGHAAAAGCTINAGVDEAKRMMLDAIAPLLKTTI